MTLATTLRDREPAVGNWLTLRDPAVAEISAELGFDFVVLDVEHTPNSLETVLAQARGMDAAGTDTEAIVRLPWNDPVVVKRVLDAGVSGVMAPMVGTAEEAEALVEATRYPPEGIRGVAGERAARYGLDLPDYVRDGPDPITIAQIETLEGLENVEAIAAVPGLDALFVGPADLSANLGVFGEWGDETFLAAVDRILEAGREAETAVSTLALEADEVERWVNRGFDFVMVGIDANYVVDGSQRAKAAFETALEERDG